MISIVIAIVGLGLLVVLHEGGHYVAARLCGMRVERFSIGFGPTLLGFKRGDTTFQIAPIPLGGFVQITGLNPNEDFDHNDPNVYPNRPRWMRFFTIVAGPLANFLTAIVVMLFVYTILGVPMPSKNERVVDVRADSAAAAAGLKAGDVIAASNGHPITATHTIRDQIKTDAGATQVLSVMRDGQPLTLTVTPRKQPTGEFLIGVQIEHYDLTALPFGAAAKQAVIYPVEKSKIILIGLYDMVTGREKAELAGPIGITREIARAANRSVWDYFGIIAMLSVYLGLFNLLPLPALDGGRALFLGIEALIRRQINPKIEATVHTVGLVVLLGVLLIVSFKDFTRLIGKG
ncbi:MAG: site-2 protease family protein [Deltaproteobacteria bacterium]|nr:site-2 protease family protein [Deltaproteobacteria bacterium]